MDKLYYIDTHNELHEVPYTRDRAMATSPIFYTSKRKARIIQKEKWNEIAQNATSKIMEIERELAKI